MMRAKVKLLGQLRVDEDGGVAFPFFNLWLEAVPAAFERQWPGVMIKPDDLLVVESREAKAIHTTEEYRDAATEFLELQRQEPQLLPLLKMHRIWAYRDKVLEVWWNEPEALRDDSQIALFVKHFVLRRDRQFERIRREVQALENLERLEKVAREPIPESVRLFVWQRDRGQCVKCGSRQRLEFDHIIPVAEGGSSTERNIQLLCETCNRSKGSNI